MSHSIAKRNTVLGLGRWKRRTHTHNPDLIETTVTYFINIYFIKWLIQHMHTCWHSDRVPRLLNGSQSPRKFHGKMVIEMVDIKSINRMIDITMQILFNNIPFSLFIIKIWSHIHPLPMFVKTIHSSNDGATLSESFCIVNFKFHKNIFRVTFIECKNRWIICKCCIAYF